MSKLSRHKKRRRKNPSKAASSATDIAESVVPGFAGYAATRFIGRVVFTTAKKRAPEAGKHLAALSGVLAAGAIWFLGDKIKQLRKYQQPLLVGAGIAALQGVAQTYIPKYGWMVADYQNEELAADDKEAQVAQGDDFDIDQFLADNGELEAVPLGLPDAGESGGGYNVPADDAQDVDLDGLGDYDQSHEDLTSFMN